MLTYGLSDLLLLAVGSLVVFVLREYILKVHVLVSSEHNLCRFEILVTCLIYIYIYIHVYIYIDQLFIERT